MDKPSVEEPPLLSRMLDLVQAGNLEQLELLRLHDIPAFEVAINTQRRFGQNPRAPLHLAIENGKRDLKWRYSTGNCLLEEYAIPVFEMIDLSEDRFEEVLELLRRGASPNIPGCYGVPPLWTACLMGSPALIDALLEAGADVNLTCSRGTPLQAACLRASPDILERIIVAGGRSDSTVPTSGLLLPWRNISLLRRLMERGVRVSVDLQGEPLALWLSITQMAKDEESFLCVMGKDALDVFLPYLIDMQLRATESVHRMRRNLVQQQGEQRRKELQEERPRRSNLAVVMHADVDEDGDGQQDGENADPDENANGNGDGDDNGDGEENGNEEQVSDEEVLKDAVPRPRRRSLRPRLRRSVGGRSPRLPRGRLRRERGRGRL